MKEYVYLGKRIRSARKAKRLTQKDLGDAVGVKFQQISKYEIGQDKPYALTLWRIAQALGVPLDYFFEDIESTQLPVSEQKLKLAA